MHLQQSGTYSNDERQQSTSTVHQSDRYFCEMLINQFTILQYKGYREAQSSTEKTVLFLATEMGLITNNNMQMDLNSEGQNPQNISIFVLHLRFSTLETKSVHFIFSSQVTIRNNRMIREFITINMKSKVDS